MTLFWWPNCHPDAFLFFAALPRHCSHPASGLQDGEPEAHWLRLRWVLMLVLRPERGLHTHFQELDVPILVWSTHPYWFHPSHVIGNAPWCLGPGCAFTSQGALFAELTWVLAEEVEQLQLSLCNFYFLGIHRMSWDKVSAAEASQWWALDPGRRMPVEARVGGGDSDAPHWTPLSDSNTGLYFLWKVIPKSSQAPLSSVFKQRYSWV